MNTAAIGSRPAAPAPVASAAPDEWRQSDIENFAPTPAQLPRFPPEHTAPAG
jgi:hypothetical protein